MGVAVGVGSRVEARVGGWRRLRPVDVPGIWRSQLGPLTIPARHLLVMPHMWRVGCSDRFAGLREGNPVDSMPQLTDPCPATPPATSLNHALSVLTPGERS